ncbi:MAG: cytochrome b [Rhodobacteraceae bacterium]|nr:MAG: cytochrome b [Paracoccaceae bacterium]
MSVHQQYAQVTRLLHWIVALMVLTTMPIGVAMLQEGIQRSTQDLLFILHKNGGVIILLLVLLRIIWRVVTPKPALPTTVPQWQKRAAAGVQTALYLLLLVMAVSGYVRVRAGGFPIEMLDAVGMPTFVPRSEALADRAQAIHATARFPLAALILLHIAAGVKHAIARDGVFSRIWPPLGR